MIEEALHHIVRNVRRVRVKLSISAQRRRGIRGDDEVYIEHVCVRLHRSDALVIEVVRQQYYVAHTSSVRYCCLFVKQLLSDHLLTELFYRFRTRLFGAGAETQEAR